MPTEDDLYKERLNPARGCINGILLGVVLWAVVIGICILVSKIV